MPMTGPMLKSLADVKPTKVQLMYSHTEDGLGKVKLGKTSQEGTSLGKIVQWIRS